MANPSSLGVDRIVQASTANDELRAKGLKKIILTAAPSIASHIALRSDTIPAARVAEMVQTARDVAETGDDKAAAAYLSLAIAVYRAAWTAAGTGRAELDAEIDEVVRDRYADEPAFAPRAPSGGDAIGMDDVVGHSAADEEFSEKGLKRTIREVAPVIARGLVDGSGAEPPETVVDLVLAARKADEAGDLQAGKAYLALAAAVYRTAWTPLDGWTPTSLNAAISRLVAREFPDEVGLDLAAPAGRVDICRFSRKQRKRGAPIDFVIDEGAPWVCAEVGGRVLRVGEDEVSSISDDIESPYEVGTPIIIAVGQDVDAVRLDRVLDTVRLRGPRTPGPGSDYYGTVVDESCFGDVGEFPTIVPVINDRSSGQRGKMRDILAMREYPAGLRVADMTFTGTTCEIDLTKYRIFAGGGQ